MCKNWNSNKKQNVFILFSKFKKNYTIMSQYRTNPPTYNLIMFISSKIFYSIEKNENTGNSNITKF